MDDITKNSEQQKQEEIVSNDPTDTPEISLEEVVKNTVKEAEAEKKAMPFPETARLTYSAYADMRPCPESIYAPIGVWNYIGMLLLFSLPVVGLIVSIIYAISAKKLARRRTATAAAVLHLTVAVLMVAVGVIMIYVMKLDLMSELKNILLELSNMIK